MYYDDDADLDLLRGKTVAVIGFGSQGHAHALNLRDSGVDVVVGLRPGSASAAKATRGRAHRARARRGGRAGRPGHDPDPRRAPGRRSSASRSRRACATATRCSSPTGSRSTSGRSPRRPRVDVLMVAPKGPGHLVRRTYAEGAGTPGLLAVAQDASGRGPRPWGWPTPRASAAPAPGSSRPPSPRRPRRTCSGSSACSAAGSASWCAPASTPWSRRATSRSWRTSSACTSSS